MDWRTEMYAVVVRETGDAFLIDGSGAMVAANVAPRVREAPGFVSAVWMTDGSGGTLNVLTFASEAEATSALEAARHAPRPPFLHLETADVLRVLASTTI
jgi:hypothetical protein